MHNVTTCGKIMNEEVVGSFPWFGGHACILLLVQMSGNHISQGPENTILNKDRSRMGHERAGVKSTYGPQSSCPSEGVWTGTGSHYFGKDFYGMISNATVGKDPR
jgi:hypothetical protein